MHFPFEAMWYIVVNLLTHPVESLFLTGCPAGLLRALVLLGLISDGSSCAFPLTLRTLAFAPLSKGPRPGETWARKHWFLEPELWAEKPQE